MTTLHDRHGRPFTVRSARPPDASAIGAMLADLARTDEFILLSPDEIAIDDLHRREEIARALACPDRWYLAAVEVDGVVAGMLDLRGNPVRRCGHVVELGVGLAPAARDRGVGTALMRHALEWAAARGFAKMRLFVIDGNGRALHLYDRLGFAETGRFRDEVRVGPGLRDLIVMERGLP